MNLIKKYFDRKSATVDFLFVCSYADLNISDGINYSSRFFRPAIVQLTSRGFSVECALWPSLKTCNFPTCYQKLPLYLKKFLPSLLFIKFIKRPRCLVVIGSGHALCRAAKNLSIPVIEIMHGFGLDSHDYVWGVDCILNPSVDKILVFDNQTFEVLSINKNTPCKAVRCTHPYLSSTNHSGVEGLDSILLSEQSNKINSLIVNKPLSVLVTLQHGYDGTVDAFCGILSNGIMHNSLIELIQDSPDLSWVIKLHPCQVIDKKLNNMAINILMAAFKGLPNVQIISSPTIDIMELIMNSDLHITMTSGTIEEAAFVGVPSIGLCPSLQKHGAMEAAFSFARSTGSLILCELNKTSIHLAIKNIARRSQSNSTYLNYQSLENKLPSIADFLESQLKSGL